MPLLNYSTRINPSRTITEIMEILARKGASEIMTVYDDCAQPVGLNWRVQTAHGPLAYGLPVNVESVLQVLTRDGVMKTDATRRWEQANRVAWRILKSWIEAQMALLETGMVQLEEIFLPYMLTGDRDLTLYQVLVERGFKALPPMPSNE